VDDMAWRGVSGWRPRLRGVYTISHTFIGDDEHTGERDLPGVDLKEDPNPRDDSGWPADMFAPVKPATQEFTEQMRAIRPVRARVSA
jgi:hypothetical protein